MTEFSADFLVMAAGVLLSWAFSYVPGLSAWFEALSSDAKRLVMLGALAVVTAAVIGLACTGFAVDLGLSASCDRVGLIAILRAFFLATMANQSAYKLSPRGARAGAG
jgi:hypothetical protein